MKPRPELHPLQLLRHSLVQNVLTLYGVQVATYIVPLVTIPYLARVLGAAGWGLVAFAQSFATYVALLVEYGFNLSATREVARHRDAQNKLTDIVAGVLGAKLWIAAASLAIAVVARWTVPIFREQPALLWTGVFWAFAQAFSTLWFFQGFERMRLVAALDIGAKVLASAGVFVFVHTPAHAWRVLAVQGAGCSLSLVAGMALVYREVPFRFPTWSSSWEALRMGWSMFLFRGSATIYTAGNAFILGLFVSPEFVGYYTGADKISRAFLGLLNPVNQSFYPRLAYLVQHARERAARLARISLAVMGAGGTVLGLVVIMLAPLLVRIVLGHGFEPAVPVLRILALLVPLIALGTVFGIHWMVPLGLDRPFNTIVLSAGVLNLVLAVILAPVYKDVGMAWAVVAAEIFVTGSDYLFLRWRKLDPITYCVTPVTTGAEAVD